MMADFHDRVGGTSISRETLLSSDYLNIFSDVIVLLSMLPNMPELLDDIHAWEFRSYTEHFRHSDLDFAPLALEAYGHAPDAILVPFEAVVGKIKGKIEEAREVLATSRRDSSLDDLPQRAAFYSNELRELVEESASLMRGSCQRGAADEDDLELF